MEKKEMCANSFYLNLFKTKNIFLGKTSRNKVNDNSETEGVTIGEQIETKIIVMATVS